MRWPLPFAILTTEEWKISFRKWILTNKNEKTDGIGQECKQRRRGFWEKDKKQERLVFRKGCFAWRVKAEILERAKSAACLLGQAGGTQERRSNDLMLCCRYKMKAAHFKWGPTVLESGWYRSVVRMQRHGRLRNVRLGCREQDASIDETEFLFMREFVGK